MRFSTVSTISLVSQLALAAPQLGDLSKLGEMVASLAPGSLPSTVKLAFNYGYGNVSAVPGAAPRKVEMPTRNPHIPNSKTVKIRYGPFKVPNAGKVNLIGEHGTLFNWPMQDQEKPCTGECMLLGVNADLEYPDGSNANIGNGMWLHHMVLFTTGPNRFDPTCTGAISLPHLLIGSNSNSSERLMASGNERTTTRFNSPYAPKDKLGYPLHDTDKFDMVIDLMNENKQDKIVYITMTYDYLEGNPEGFSNFRTIWLDIVKCGTSEMQAPTETGAFNISQKWIANLNADILGAGGHLHDGGTHITLSVDGKEVCDSVASYGVTPKDSGKPNGASGGGMMGGGMMGGDMMGAAGRVTADLRQVVYPSSDGSSLRKRDGPEHGATGMPHITKMTTCVGSKINNGKIVKGQNWGIHAYYDYEKHEGMKNAKGSQSNVMGIVLMMVKNWSA